MTPRTTSSVPFEQWDLFGERGTWSGNSNTFQVSFMDLATAAIATLAFYAVTFAAAIKLTDKTPDDKAVFWHIATRYITLALILAVFSVDTFGATFILPIMFAYFIQIGAAGFLAKIEIEQTAK